MIHAKANGDVLSSIDVGRSGDLIEINEMCRRIGYRLNRAFGPDDRVLLALETHALCGKNKPAGDEPLVETRITLTVRAFIIIVDVFVHGTARFASLRESRCPSEAHRCPITTVEVRFPSRYLDAAAQMGEERQCRSHLVHHRSCRLFRRSRQIRMIRGHPAGP